MYESQAIAFSSFRYYVISSIGFRGKYMMKPSSQPVETTARDTPEHTETSNDQQRPLPERENESHTENGPS